MENKKFNENENEYEKKLNFLKQKFSMTKTGILKLAVFEYCKNNNIVVEEPKF